MSYDGSVKRWRTIRHRTPLHRGALGRHVWLRSVPKGKKYRCKAKHENAHGWGPWSAWQKVKHRPARPAAPARVKARRKKPRVAKVRFKAGRVHYRKVTKSRTKCVSPRGVTVKEVNRHPKGLRKGDVARVWIQGLSKRRAYRCKVKLRNSQGWGDWSDKTRVRRR